MKRNILEFPKLEELGGLPFIKQDVFLDNGKLRKWRGSVQKVHSPICDPKTGEQLIIGSYPLLTKKESLQILNSALKAYDRGSGAWPTMKVTERIRCVQNFVMLMKERREEVVNLIMWEIGKTKKAAESEFDRTVEYINETIVALKDLDHESSVFNIEELVIGQIRRAPLGITLCMGPYNYPLNETFTTLIPALIMGNTVIFKPPKFGVLLHSPILEAFQTSFPKGVVNTVYGEGQEVIGPLMESGNIDILAFIGSSRVADILKKQHPKPHRLKGIMGLEAKNAAIILNDANIDETIAECVKGSLSYNGQRCTALKIIFVHKKIAKKFRDKFVKVVDKLHIGMPWEDNVDLTPLPNIDSIDFLKGLLADAQDRGAKIINKQHKINNTLFFPAVLYGVKSNMRIWKEEQFGPIVPIVTYSKIEEPIQYIVDSNYGQQVSVFGSNSKKIAKLIDPLVNQVCRVNVNTQCQRGPDSFPFGGRKDSAEGTLSIRDALKCFSIQTMVATKETESNKKIFTNIVKNNESNFLDTDYIL